MKSEKWSFFVPLMLATNWTQPTFDCLVDTCEKFASVLENFQVQSYHNRLTSPKNVDHSPTHTASGNLLLEKSKMCRNAANCLLISRT